MTVLAIELCDAALSVAGGGRALLESPGYALLDGEQLQVGEEAARRARLHPRQIECHFWQRLGQGPLVRPGAGAHTQADLAYLHLVQLWQRVGADGEAVVFAVPGCFEKEQLGQVLGLAHAAGIPVVGMVDAGLAAVASLGSGGALLHLDVHLHRTVLSWLRADPALGLVRVDTNAQLGQRWLYDTWLKLIAELFVRRTRFDPLHRAESEQALFDLLPGCLRRLDEETSATVPMRSRGTSYSVVVQRDQLAQAAHSRYEQLLAQIERELGAGERPRIALSDRAALLPGLAALLDERLGCERVVLPPGAAALGALALEGKVRSPDGSTRLVTSLAGPLVSPPEVRRAPEPADPTPSHLLYRNRAFAIGSKPIGVALSRDAGGAASLSLGAGGSPAAHCTLFRSGSELLLEPHGRGDVRIEGRPLAGRATLRLGDCIEIEGCADPLQVIAVDEHGGAT